MEPYVSDFLNSRIEEIIQNLKQTNGEYALAVEQNKNLMESIDPIISRDRDIAISAGDCMNFRDFLNEEFTQTAILQKELYRQGYLDCVKLLKTLQIL